MNPIYKRVIIKVGSNVLADDAGLPDIEVFAHLVKEITALRQSGVEVMLVSSGAVAAGKGWASKQANFNKEKLDNKQMMAAIGQVSLLNIYNQLFSLYGQSPSQILITKTDFRLREQYDNIHRCMEELLDSGLIPIINENDVVAQSLDAFLDNDELSGMIACMMEADALLILTNVDGLFDRNPEDPNAKLIEQIEQNDSSIDSYIVASKSKHGRGGMKAKANVALNIAQAGIHAHLFNGHTKGLIQKVVGGETCGTHFVANATKDYGSFLLSMGYSQFSD